MAPSDGQGGYLYSKADGKIYWRSNEVSETDLTSGGGGGSGASNIDGLTDAKAGGTNFSNSLILGHQTTGSPNSASQNTAVGFAADAIISGQDNVCVGYNAGTEITTGSANAFLGSDTGVAITTGF